MVGGLDRAEAVLLQRALEADEVALKRLVRQLLRRHRETDVMAVFEFLGARVDVPRFRVCLFQEVLTLTSRSSVFEVAIDEPGVWTYQRRRTVNHVDLMDHDALVMVGSTRMIQPVLTPWVSANSLQAVRWLVERMDEVLADPRVALDARSTNAAQEILDAVLGLDATRLCEAMTSIRERIHDLELELGRSNRDAITDFALLSNYYLAALFHQTVAVAMAILKRFGHAGVANVPIFLDHGVTPYVVHLMTLLDMGERLTQQPSLALCGQGQRSNWLVRERLRRWWWGARRAHPWLQREVYLSWVPRRQLRRWLLFWDMAEEFAEACFFRSRAYVPHFLTQVLGHPR